MTIIPN